MYEEVGFFPSGIEAVIGDELKRFGLIFEVLDGFDSVDERRGAERGVVGWVEGCWALESWGRQSECDEGGSLCLEGTLL